MTTEENKVMPEAPKETNTGSGEKLDTTTGLIAYLTLIGFVIALVLNNEKKGEEKAFGAFHLRQSLGLMLTGIVAMIALMILSSILLVISYKLLIIMSIIWPVFYLGLLALVVVGIINAANGQKKELPVIGAFISKTFKKAFD